MRLWHEALLPVLPRAQLLGQHRECCALRGGSWGRPHAVVDYVFTHPREALYAYHRRVMAEMERRGFRVEDSWQDAFYRGRNLPWAPADASLVQYWMGRTPVYPEHGESYLRECLQNLKEKGIAVETDTLLW